MKQLDERRIREILADLRAGRTSAIALFTEHGVDAATLSRWRKKYAGSAAWRPAEPVPKPMAASREASAIPVPAKKTARPAPTAPNVAAAPPRRRRRYSPDQVRQILTEWDGGLRPAEVAEKYGLNPTMLYKWRRRHSQSTPERASSPPIRTEKAAHDMGVEQMTVEDRPAGRVVREHTKDKIQQILAEWAAGANASELGRKYHIPRQYLYRWRRAYGMPQGLEGRREPAAWPEHQLARGTSGSAQTVIRQHLEKLIAALEAAIREDLCQKLIARLEEPE